MPVLGRTCADCPGANVLRARSRAGTLLASFPIMSPEAPGATDAAARARRWLAAARRRPRPDPGPEIGPGEHHQLAVGRLCALASALEPDDPSARGHADRVGSLTRRLALVMGLTPDEAEIVGLAGRLHDIGILGGRATADGAELACRRHPVIGAQLVTPFDVLGIAAPMIRHHHERLDGSGYPDGLRGERIPIGARIIAVADEYDRLTTAPLGVAPPPGEAFAHLLRHGGRTLDGGVIAAFLDLAQRPLP